MQQHCPKHICALLFCTLTFGTYHIYKQAIQSLTVYSQIGMHLRNVMQYCALQLTCHLVQPHSHYSRAFLAPADPLHPCCSAGFFFCSCAGHFAWLLHPHCHPCVYVSSSPYVPCPYACFRTSLLLPSCEIPCAHACQPHLCDCLIPLPSSSSCQCLGYYD